MLRKNYIKSKIKLSRQNFEVEFAASFEMLEFYDTANY